MKELPCLGWAVLLADIVGSASRRRKSRHARRVPLGKRSLCAQLCCLFLFALPPRVAIGGIAVSSPNPCGCVSPSDMAIDAAGNVILLGDFQYSVDFGGGELVSAGWQDVFLAKFDSAGNHLWSKRFGDAFENYGPRGVAVDGAGNIVIAGQLSGTWDFGAGPITGFADIYIVKFDGAGNHLWTRQFGLSTYSYAGDVTIDSSGNIAFWGSSLDPLDFGGGVLPGAGLFMVKLDSAGSHVWSRAFGGLNIPLDFEFDGAGNVIFAGNLSGSGDFGGGVLTTNGMDDVLVVKLDPDGNHVWSQNFGDASLQDGRGIVADNLGNMIVTGFFEGTIDFGSGALTAAGTDAFLAKFDPSGSHIYSRSFSGPGSDYSNSVAVDDSGRVTITGWFNGNIDLGGGPIASAGGSDVFIAKFDGDGNHLWSEGYGDLNEQAGTDIAVDNAGNLVFAGGFLGAVDFGGGPLVNTGDWDTYLGTLDPDGSHTWSQSFGNTVIVGIPDVEISNPQAIHAYPNPFNPETTIRYPVPRPGSVVLQIFDTRGRLVRVLVRAQKSAGEHVVSWDGRDSYGMNVASGVYFVSLKSGGQEMSRKIVLLR